LGDTLSGNICLTGRTPAPGDLQSTARLTSEHIAVHKAGGRVRNRAAREQALITAARRLFASRGYEATTTRQIAAEAGCAEGLIHRYFHGKEGLLFAIARSCSSRETVDMNKALPRTSSLDHEITQLLEYEIERAWEDRELFRVLVPRALLDSDMGSVLNRVGPLRRAHTIRERLKTACNGRSVPDGELEALAHFIGSMGFMFGFLRPVVLGDERTHAKALAKATATMLARAV
jgi:AcrR family transcriptional regulator